MHYGSDFSLNRADTKIEIDLDELAGVTPFVLTTDQNKTVTWASDAILKRIPDAIGMLGTEITEHQDTQENISSESLAGNMGRIHRLNLCAGESRIPLIGRWLAFHEGFLLLANPDARTIEDLSWFSFDDFSSDNHLIELLTGREETQASLKEAASAIKISKEKNRELNISRQRLESVNATLENEIADRKKAETELRKAEEKYRMLFEEALDAIFVADIETGILIDCNSAGTELVGREKSELIGQSHMILHPPEDEAKFFTTFKQHLKDQCQTLETKIITTTGEIREVAIKANVIEIEGRKVLQGIFRDITENKQREKELLKVHKELVSASYRAGMAEVATDVLHNVGNVLNSINVSTTVITEKVKESEVKNLQKVANIINNHINDLGTFFTENPQGKHIPIFLTEVSKLLIDEQAETLSKLQILSDNVQHIKDIISTQQSYAKIAGGEVTASLSELVEDAIQINRAGLQRHGTRLIREFEELPDVEINKQKVLQILVNLISNAKYATSSSQNEEKTIIIRTYKHQEDRFRIEVADNGVGIPKENLTRIFSHGFTTKKDGHGFGLHSSALAANEIGGKLTVYSEGVEKGTTFTLELPFKTMEIVTK